MVCFRLVNIFVPVDLTSHVARHLTPVSIVSWIVYHCLEYFGYILCRHFSLRPMAQVAAYTAWFLGLEFKPWNEYE